MFIYQECEHHVHTIYCPHVTCLKNKTEIFTPPTDHVV